MSKRFEWHSYYKRMVLDTKINKIIKVIDTLNQQSERIAELEEQLKNATKQVRKEVCEEIKHKIEKRNNGTRNANYSVEYKDGYSGCCCDLEEILDQIKD